MSLPDITGIEPRSEVENRAAAVIWFGDDDRALRYVTDDSQVLEQTYSKGITYASYPVGGEHATPAEAALAAVDAYLFEYKDDPEKMADEWPHVHELLTA